jgi:hypothetical protein
MAGVGSQTRLLWPTSGALLATKRYRKALLNLYLTQGIKSGTNLGLNWPKALLGSDATLILDRDVTLLLGDQTPTDF